MPMQERDGIGRGNYPSDTLSFCPSKRRVEIPRPRDLEKRHAYSERLHSGLKLATVLGHWIGRTRDDAESRRRRQSLFEELDVLLSESWDEAHHLRLGETL